MIGVIALVVASYLLPIATAIAVAPDWTQLTEGSYPDLAEHIGVGMHQYYFALYIRWLLEFSVN